MLVSLADETWSPIAGTDHTDISCANDVIRVDASTFLVVGAGSYGGATTPFVKVNDFQGGWRSLTNDAPVGHGINDISYWGAGFGAVGDANDFWTATAVDRWSRPTSLPFGASRLFLLPDPALLLLGEGIWTSADATSWSQQVEGDQFEREWAYARGVAIGCNSQNCRAYVADDLR
jgi:hypothetical protein